MSKGYLNIKFIFIAIIIKCCLFFDLNRNVLSNQKNLIKIPNQSNIKINRSDSIWKEYEIGRDKKIIWEKLNDNNDLLLKYDSFRGEQDNEYSKNNFLISSLNRSIVFNNDIIGPDISWKIQNGFMWSSKYKLDSSIRGYNQDYDKRRISSQKFLEWNDGDAVGQFYYQFLSKENFSYGINMGMRSILGGESGAGTPIGDGLSLGFRGDYKLSDSSGFAFGGEQIIHISGVTDTGRDFYVSISKGFWRDNISGKFPLKIATASLGTGRLAEGNIKGLCSDLFGGASTEANHQRRLCWAPGFSLAYLFNQNLSTFFEYNSRFFLIGTSLAPFKRIPFRGTFAVTISDHIDNYEPYGLDEMTWTFRLSMGF
tara:strand:+ start:10325 stop:11431 length:1107 start_codon:yes stop_codon:yes gene_type:complete